MSLKRKADQCCSSSLYSPSKRIIISSCLLFSLPDDLLYLILQCLSFRELLDIQTASTHLRKLACSKQAWAFIHVYFSILDPFLAGNKLELVKGLSIKLCWFDNENETIGQRENAFVQLALKHRDSLERLDIEQSFMLSLECYLEIGRLTHLRILNISDGLFGMNVESFDFLCELKQLEILQLPTLALCTAQPWPNTGRRPLNAQDFAPFKQLKKLQFIHATHRSAREIALRWLTKEQAVEVYHCLMESIAHVPQVSLFILPLFACPSLKRLATVNALSLYLSFNDDDDDDFRALSQTLTSLKGVKRLFVRLSVFELVGNCRKNGAFLSSFFQIVKAMNWLHELYIEVNSSEFRHHVDCQCFDYFNDTGLFHRHNELHIFQLHAFHELPFSSLNFKEAPLLTSVSLHGCQLKVPSGWSFILTSLSSELVHLDLYGTQIPIDALPSLLTRFPKLQYLDVGGNDTSFVRIISGLFDPARALMKRLISDRTDAKWTNDFVQLLNCLPQSIRVLRLSCTYNVNDGFIEQLVRSFPLIEELDLERTAVSDDSVKALESLLHLRELYVHNTAMSVNVEWELSKKKGDPFHGRSNEWPLIMLNNRVYKTLHFKFAPFSFFPSSSSS